VNLLNSLDATVGMIGFFVALSIAWLYFEPRYNHKKITHSSSFMEIFWWIAFPVGFLIIATNIIASTSWRFPITQADLMYDLFMTRVGNLETTAHSISYLTLPIFFFYSFYRTKDSWYSALATGFIAFVHEAIWFVFYWAVYYDFLDVKSEFLPVANFMILIVTIGILYFVKYGLDWLVYLTVVTQIMYDIIWSLLGFPITCTNNSGAMIRFGITKWFYDIGINAIEVMGWLFLLYFACLGVILNTRKEKSIM